MTGDASRAAGDAADRVSEPAEIDRRLAAFRRTGDPSEMWPGLSERARAAAAAELARVASLVLSGGAGERVDPGDAHAAYALQVASHTTGVGPLFGAWAERGVVVLPVTARAFFAAQIAHSRRRAARMERELLPALDALTAGNVRPVVLKGFHTARAYFGEPGERRMADVDLWVPPDRVTDAEEALASAGFVARGPALRPYRREWAGPRVDGAIRSLEYSHELNPWVIELHGTLDRRFQRGAVARFDAERAAVEAWSVAGHELLVQRQPLLLLTLACHCSQELAGSRLLRLIEMVNIIRTDTAAGRLDWEEALAMMRRTGVSRFTYPAFALVEQLAPGCVHSRALELARRESTWAARHTVARLSTAGGSLDQRGVLRQWMWTRGPVAVGQRLLWSIWPAAFTPSSDVMAGWRARMRRLRVGRLTLTAPDERNPERDRPSC
jgi:hypothetical protein